MTTKTDNRTTETWTYCGRRLAGRKGDKLVGLWLDVNGDERMFTGADFQTRAIGATYSIEVERKPDDAGVTVYGTPTLHDPEAAESDPRVPSWEALSTAAMTADNLRKREDKLRRDGSRFGELTLDEVGAIARRLPAPQRRALMAQVLARLGA